MKPAATYVFQPVGEADLALLDCWRAKPHVAAWWGPPEIETPAEAFADPRVAMWIVMHDGRPFAYAQDYAPRDWDGHPFAHLPPGARGMDHYVGDADMLGRGHGSAFIRAHCRRLFAGGAPAIGVDPHPENKRSIRAYEKAGFAVTSGPLDTRWGRAVLMEQQPRATLRGQCPAGDARGKLYATNWRTEESLIPASSGHGSGGA